MGKAILTLILSFSFLFSQAQVQKIVVGVNGLTCSQCSKSVYNKLNQLTFIKKIEMDLNDHTAILTLKNENEYDIDGLAKAVVESGYSVRNILLHFKKDNLDFSSDHWLHNGMKFYYDAKSHPEVPPLFIAEILGRKYNSDRKINRLMPDHFTSPGKTYFVLIH